MSIPTTIQQPLSALFKQADQVQEFLNLARQKVEFATAQNAFGNGVPTFDTISEALPAMGMATMIAAAAAVGGYFVYKWINHRRAMDMTTASTT
jgi:DNA-binding phage protein